MISIRLIRLASLPSDRALRAISDTLPFGAGEAERRGALPPASFRESMGAWIALKELITGRALSAPLTTHRGINGKPLFEDPSLPAFNLSHTDGLSAAVLGEDGGGEVGIDVQLHKPMRSTDAIVSRFFSSKEQALWARSDRSDDAFFRLWTQKEALAKLRGDTLLSETAFSARATVSFRTYRLRWDSSLAYLTVAAEHPLGEIEILSDKEIIYEAI